MKYFRAVLTAYLLLVTTFLILPEGVKADLQGITASFVPFNLTFLTAAAKIIPGATNLVVRNAANSQDNVTISNTGAVGLAGDVTFLTNGANTINCANTSCLFKVNGNTLMTLQGSDNSTQILGKLQSAATSDLGWSVVAGANTACNTTCTSACVFGLNLTAGNITGSLLACTDATADVCLCAGAS